MDANVVLLALQDKVSSEGLSVLQDKLKNANESQLEKIVITPFKNPIIGLILGFFLGFLGVDRFYKGNIFIGILKILIPLILLFISFFTIWYGGSEELFISAIIIAYTTSLGWWFIDLFLVWKGIKRDNLNRILMQL